jgi:undecaprenyl pyrophosphate phosphatase UppP
MDVTDFAQVEDSLAPPQVKPRTAAVIGLLVVAAAIFSYLVAYCLMNALVAAEIVPHWPAGRDPRPKVFLGSMTALLAAFTMVGFFFRTISRRHFNRIEQMEEEAAA